MSTITVDHRSNNFDTIRIIAAFAVIVSHSFTLMGQSELLFDIDRGRASIGDFAVLSFFTISGYLISQSFLRSRNPLNFTISRVLRIMPALFVVALISSFVVGPIFTNFSLRQYFVEKETYSYIVHNVFLTMRYNLPGVFDANPYPHAVNGSLWTLPKEVICYIIVLALGCFRMLRPAVCIACVAVMTAIVIKQAEQRMGVNDFYVAFAFGAVIATCGMVWSGWLCVGSCIAALTALVIRGPMPIVDVCTSYAVLYVCLSHNVSLPRFARRGDISYGLYIWAFPVQQMVASTVPAWFGWAANIILSTPIIVVLAYLSWHLIEKPSLSLKKLVLRRPRRGADDEPPLKVRLGTAGRN